MNSRTYIRDKKKMVSATQWASGAIPKAHYPLFKMKGELGPAWRWRAAVLKSATTEYRLLVQVRWDKPNYKAWLAVLIGLDWATIARLEIHPHAGLHCHLQCPDQGVEVGVIAPKGVLFPRHKAQHRRKKEVKSETDAWEKALEFFRAQTAEVGLLGI